MVTAVTAVLLQPLLQIQMFADAIVVSAIFLFPCQQPAVSAKPSSLRCRRFCLDVAATSVPRQPQGPVRQVLASTIAAVLPLLLLLPTLRPRQVSSATMLSQPLLLFCHSLFQKSEYAPLTFLSLLSCCRLSAALPSLPSQVFSAAVVIVLKVLLPLCQQI